MDNIDKQTITATASPRPWRVADIDHDHDILDADGKVAARKQGTLL